MSLLDRGPDGKFLGWGGAIRAWIPKLLDSYAPSRAVGCTLDAMAEWCEEQSGINYQRAAENITGRHRELESSRERLAKGFSLDAERWLRRAAALRAAKKVVEEA